ncbi:hypothetical protein EZV61_01905 [Corallincola luteus]|uniref:Uncharacterized protein n=1 Tax=Corallincola luteus TaxID=1775177 RepID=A0ABY2ANJ6_9GAMM|nr:hypothetical protein [Corallincola luteus]TCI04750.1 hypothetical protein EZV61_01905 [Corallincola luteus]
MIKPMKSLLSLAVAFFLLPVFIAEAVSLEDKVVVRKSSEPRETSIWELREQLKQEKEFEQWLRHQQDWYWISQLPAGCIIRKDLGGNYDCGGRFYWPYRGRDRSYFLEMTEQQLRDMPASKEMPDVKRPMAPSPPP